MLATSWEWGWGGVGQPGVWRKYFFTVLCPPIDCSQSPIFPWDSRHRARLTVNGSHLDFKCTESIKSRWPPLTVTRARSRRSYGKIGDCEQSSFLKAIFPGHFNSSQSRASSCFHGTYWKGTWRALFLNEPFLVKMNFICKHHENENSLSNDLRRLDIQWEIQYKSVGERPPEMYPKILH